MNARWIPLAAGLCLLSVTAHAQQPQRQGTQAAAGSDANYTQQARDFFEQGVAAYRDSRYADALRLFDQSYRLRRTASVALNRGVTLRAMGRLVEARDAFREVFELATDRQRGTLEPEVRGYLTEIARRVSTVHIEAMDPPVAAITVDDRRVTPDTAGNFDIDPGQHTLFIEAAGRTALRQSITIPEKTTVPVTITLARLGQGTSTMTGPGLGSVSQNVATTTTATQTNTAATQAAANAVKPPPARGGSVATSPVLWTIVGVVVVGGAVTGTVLAINASTPATLPPASTGVNIALP